MRKFIAATLLLLPLFSQAAPLVENVHYKVLSTEKSETKKITEFFSFYCPHCFNFEPLMNEIKKDIATKHKDVELNKSHVDFIRGASPQTMTLLAKAQSLAVLVKKPEITEEIFKAIHEAKKPIETYSDFQKLFEKHGIHNIEFQNLFNSKEVEQAANKMKFLQTKYKDDLKGVPTLMINDKYMLMLNGFKASSYEDLFNQVKEAAFELTEK
ncbi:thiol:disulfide interchange protein DsbA/DsbL [Pseudoalteromonas marina]|uniref:Thiol:disulfide interchange protein n=1 Tax=Pseudoalteromonas marina TaxID=267375 RepID=A0ABT9FK21_9GAMM|nr:thiol:disulfide interchange protein DsbA/DsbL [Pseudoalteromonas marina]MDP2567133.1 thiol:disulfide interchange protein DsbA/DsbL [Pseudoalteromonas marina]